MSTRLTKRQSEMDIFSEEEKGFFVNLFKGISKSELTINMVEDGLMNEVCLGGDNLEAAILINKIEKRTSKDIKDISRIILFRFL